MFEKQEVVLWTTSCFIFSCERSTKDLPMAIALLFLAFFAAAQNPQPPQKALTPTPPIKNQPKPTMSPPAIAGTQAAKPPAPHEKPAYMEEACNKSKGWGFFCKFNLGFEKRGHFNYEGQVGSLEPITIEKGMSPGVLLKLKYGQVVAEIILGPEWYFDQQDEILKPGDKLIVSGFEGFYQGKRLHLAERLAKGNRALQLIHHDGSMAWNAWAPIPPTIPRRK